MSHKAVVAFFSFTLPIILYFITLCPTAFWIDSGELAASAYTLGIAHPSGYPLYVIMGRLFSLLPTGEVAARLAFFSALCGAFSSLFVFLSSLRLTGQVLMSFICSLIASFSLNMWDLSNIAEVYSLNVMFTAVITYLLIILVEEGKKKILYLLTFLIGLGMTNHLTLGVVIPSMAIVLFSIRKKIDQRSMRLIYILVPIFMLGLSLYLYIPIRAACNPALNWGNPRTPSSLLGHLSLSSYQEYFFKRSSQQVFRMMEGISDFYLKGFGIPGSILIFAGFVIMVRRKVTLCFAFLLPILILTAFVVNFGSGGRMAEEQQSFYLASTVFAAMFLAESLSGIKRYLTRKLSNNLPVYLVTAAFSMIPVSLIAVNYRQVDKSWDRSAIKFAELIYDSMDKPAILLTDHTTLAFVFSYIQVVNGGCEDIVPIYMPLLQHEWYREKLVGSIPSLVLEPDEEFTNLASFVKDNSGKFHVYTRQAFAKKIIPSRFLVPSGPVMKVSMDTVNIDRVMLKEHRALLHPYENESQYLRNRSFKVNLVITYVTVAKMLTEAGLYDDALAEARKGFLLDRQSSGTYLIVAEICERQGRVEEAIEWYERALEYEPENHGAMLKMGILYEKLLKTGDALSMYERALEKNPEFAAAHARLGFLLYRNKGDLARALYHLREAVRLGYSSAGMDSVMHELEENWKEE